MQQRIRKATQSQPTPGYFEISDIDVVTENAAEQAVLDSERAFALANIKIWQSRLTLIDNKRYGVQKTNGAPRKQPGTSMAPRRQATNGHDLALNEPPQEKKRRGPWAGLSAAGQKELRAKLSRSQKKRHAKARKERQQAPITEPAAN
jgi:hypothetical protein